MKRRKHKRTFKCEGDVKEEAKNIMKWHGVWFFMPHMAGKGRAGIPDIIMCVCGYFVAVETKFGDNTPTESQEDELEAIKASWGVAVVLNEKNIGKLEEIILLIKDKAKGL